jgi:hypothetical protein
MTDTVFVCMGAILAVGAILMGVVGYFIMGHPILAAPGAGLCAGLSFCFIITGILGCGAIPHK